MQSKRAWVYDKLPIESMRYDAGNDYLHVNWTRMTKSQVAVYRGFEIVDSEKHGLDPNGYYKVWRPPEELARPETINSIKGIPVTLDHEFIDVNKKPKHVVGSTGDNAAWKAPYLMGSLHIYDKDAMRRIDDGSMRQLSLAYSYRPDWRSGKTPDGEHYDLIMRDIIANHVALVENGRAGEDVCVADSGKSVNRKAKTKTTKTKTTTKAKAADKRSAKARSVTTKRTIAMDEQNNLAEQITAVKQGLSAILAALGGMQPSGGAPADPMAGAADEDPDEGYAGGDEVVADEDDGGVAGGDDETTFDSDEDLTEDDGEDVTEDDGDEVDTDTTEDSDEELTEDDGDECEGTTCDDDEDVAPAPAPEDEEQQPVVLDEEDPRVQQFLDQALKASQYADADEETKKIYLAGVKYALEAAMQNSKAADTARAILRGGKLATKSKTKTKRRAADSGRKVATKSKATKPSLSVAALQRKFSQKWDAAEDVKPVLGKISMTAFDSAEALYFAALDKLGYSGKVGRKAPLAVLRDTYHAACLTRNLKRKSRAIVAAADSAALSGVAGDFKNSIKSRLY